MRPENEQYLQSKYYHWVALRDGGYIKDLSNEERQQFLNIYRAEFDPRYLANLTCMECVAKLLTDLFSQFDKYKEEKKKEEENLDVNHKINTVGNTRKKNIYDTPNSRDRP